PGTPHRLGGQSRASPYRGGTGDLAVPGDIEAVPADRARPAHRGGDFMIPAAKPLIGDEERSAVDRVMLSGMLAQGPEVAAFESEFSEIVDGRHSIAVNSGTSALHMSLIAAGIGAGDEIIVPSFSFAATANAVHLAGATAVFADIETDYFALDPAAVEEASTPRTKAIMPVHL